VADDSDAEKTEEPSQQRIDDFRKKGDVAMSRELTSVLVLAACFLTFSLSIVYIYEEMTKYMEWLYSLDIASAFTDKSLRTIITRTVIVGLKCAAPITLVALIVGVLAQVAQIGFLYSPEILELNFDRINPLSGFKKLFSMKSVVESIKGVFKFIVLISICYLFLKNDLVGYNGFMHMELYQSFMYGKGILIKLSFAMILGMTVIAILDFAYQKISYHNRLKQTRREPGS